MMTTAWLSKHKAETPSHFPRGTAGGSQFVVLNALRYLRAEGAALNTISRKLSVKRLRCHPMSRFTASGFCRESIMLIRFICTVQMHAP